MPEGVPSGFLYERVEELGNNNQYLVIRVPHAKYWDTQAVVIEAIKEVNKDAYIINADQNALKHPLSDEHITIAEIPSRLMRKPDRPTVMIIKQALRVGIVVPPEASVNINQMVDTLAIHDATVAQSLAGRSCGYGTKGEDTYPIFTQLKGIERVIRSYNGERIDPSSQFNKLSQTFNSGIYKIVNKEFLIEGRDYSAIVHCSKNFHHDVARTVLNDDYKWGNRLYEIDGPNPDHMDSWELLKKYRPDFIGKNALYIGNGENVIMGRLKDNFIDKIDNKQV